MITWKQKCEMCKKWFICSHKAREICYQCKPALYVDERKPKQFKPLFKQSVIILLNELKKAKKLKTIKNLIEEFEDDNAEDLYQ